MPYCTSNESEWATTGDGGGHVSGDAPVEPENRVTQDKSLVASFRRHADLLQLLYGTTEDGASKTGIQQVPE